MKSYIRATALFVLLSLSFYSCKKCTKCEVKDSVGNIIQNETQTCGNSTETDKAKADAKALSLLIGGSYTCSDE